jgi:hypothetical protein
MIKKYEKSLKLNVTRFRGKKFKILCDTIRSGVKQEHGFQGTKGITDKRLGVWPIVIRFATDSNRERFVKSMKSLLSPTTLAKMDLDKLKPAGRSPKAIRVVRS